MFPFEKKVFADKEFTRKVKRRKILASNKCIGSIISDSVTVFKILYFQKLVACIDIYDGVHPLLTHAYDEGIKDLLSSEDCNTGGVERSIQTITLCFNLQRKYVRLKEFLIKLCYLNSEIVFYALDLYLIFLSILIVSIHLS